MYKKMTDNLTNHELVVLHMNMNFRVHDPLRLLIGELHFVDFYVPIAFVS